VLEQALAVLAKDDPTFRWSLDPETGQTIISGMGELHLEILKNRLLSNFKVDARVGQPRVAYKQTIAAVGEGEAEFRRTIAGKNLFARVRLRVEPAPDATKFEFKSEVDPADLPKAFQPAIEGGAKSEAVSGLGLGYSVIRVRAALIGAKAVDGESNDTAFMVAAEDAFEAAMVAGGVQLLEPIMSFEIRTPSEYVKNVIADLKSRRAEVSELIADEDPVRLRGKMPLSESFGYSTQIRSLSQGRASFSMEPSDYSVVPPDVSKRLLV
jgi:elongation factor G